MLLLHEQNILLKLSMGNTIVKQRSNNIKLATEKKIVYIIQELHLLTVMKLFNYLINQTQTFLIYNYY